MGTDDEMVNVPYDLVWELFDLVVDGADENMESVRMIAPLTRAYIDNPDRHHGGTYGAGRRLVADAARSAALIWQCGGCDALGDEACRDCPSCDLGTVADRLTTLARSGDRA